MRNEIQVAGQQTGIKLRPYEHHAKYYETDQMGIIHHSNYVKWMEEARMDLMDQMGLSYKQMEEMEIISPVLSIAVEYHSMVHFDDTVVIQTKLVKYNGIKMEVEYVMTDKETGELRTTARSSHCFLNVIEMSVVERIVFGDKTCDFHCWFSLSIIVFQNYTIIFFV